MTKGIVIGASEATRPFYNDLMATIKTDYPVYTCWEELGRPKGSYEIGAIEAGSKLFDEFIYLHDTTIIKDNALFDKMFAIEGNVALTNQWYHYMGKIATLPPFPKVTNKEEAIHWEIRWFTHPYTVFEDELPYHSGVFEEKYGRKNMVLENNYIKKYKARWA